MKEKKKESTLLFETRHYARAHTKNAKKYRDQIGSRLSMHLFTLEADPKIVVQKAK